MDGQAPSLLENYVKARPFPARDVSPLIQPWCGTVGYIQGGFGMEEGAGRTIMVVEDYDDTRLMLKAMLEAKGYVVLEAVNGQEAVEVATAARPDLIRARG